MFLTVPGGGAVQEQKFGNVRAEWLGMENDSRAFALALKQHGLISRQQARHVGLSDSAIDRRINGKFWSVLFPGVFRVSTSRDTWKQECMAACLWAGPRAAVSYRAAARLHGLGGFRIADVEISVATGKVRRGIIVHRVRGIGRLYLSQVEGIPVTSMTQTLLDLAGTVDADELERSIDEALRRRMTDIPRLRSILRRRAKSGKEGASVLQKVINARDPKAELADSELEDRILRLIRSAQLPLPEVHFNVVEGNQVGRGGLRLSEPENNHRSGWQGFARDHRSLREGPGSSERLGKPWMAGPVLHLDDGSRRAGEGGGADSSRARTPSLKAGKLRPRPKRSERLGKRIGRRGVPRNNSCHLPINQ
jgi:hypothetical protein